MTEQPAVLAIWHDIEEAHSTEILGWYDHEHHAERIGIPGFLRARRHGALRGPESVFIYYETVSLGVLSSPEYLARLDNPTPWTRRSMRHFRNNVRSACRVIHDSPGPDGAVVGTVRLRPREERVAALRNHLLGTVFPELHRERQVLRTRLWIADSTTTTIPSAERGLRPGGDQAADWIVVVSDSRSDVVAEHLDGRLSPSALATAGACSDAVTGLYRLDFTLDGHGPYGRPS